MERRGVQLRVSSQLPASALLHIAGHHADAELNPRLHRKHTRKPGDRINNDLQLGEAVFHHHLAEGRIPLLLKPRIEAQHPLLVLRAHPLLPLL